MTQHEPWRREPPADPTGLDKPHDVLAADEFGIGTRDDRLPPDPNRFDPPHDILAAEEFAMPAAGEHHAGEPYADSRRGPEPRTLVPLLAIAGLLGLLALVRRRG